MTNNENSVGDVMVSLVKYIIKNGIKTNEIINIPVIDIEQGKTFITELLSLSVKDPIVDSAMGSILIYDPFNENADPTGEYQGWCTYWWEYRMHIDNSEYRNDKLIRRFKKWIIPKFQ